MCGRFARIVPVSKIAMEYGLADRTGEVVPGYNIAPGDNIVTGVAMDVNSVVVSRWGMPLINRNGQRRKVINVRLETLAMSRVYDGIFRQGRCLIFADGFYEWAETGGRKQPYYIRMKNREVFAMAGLCVSADEIQSAILTREAEGGLEDLHGRMPVILDKEEAARWIGGWAGGKSGLRKLRPDTGVLEYFPVSKKVNSPSFDGPDCIKRVAAGDE